MCGRFETIPSLQTLLEILKDHDLDVSVDLSSNSVKAVNIAPTEEIFSIYGSDKNLHLLKTKWGIKFSSDSPLIFNSRIETIKGKIFWENLFTQNRALVPMSGFYEWKKEKDRKVPYRVFLPDEELFFVPALYYIDKDKNFCTSLITTKPNDFIKQIHHRMPVILKLEEGRSFLNSAKESIIGMCVPFEGEMRMEKAEI